jgi:hypothetical protein
MKRQLALSANFGSLHCSLSSVFGAGIADTLLTTTGANTTAKTASALTVVSIVVPVTILVFVILTLYFMGDNDGVNEPSLFAALLPSQG